MDVLQENVLREIAAQGNVHTFPANTVFISEGDRTNSLYIIISGRVKVFSTTADGKTIVFGTHGPGEYVGELALDGSPRAASASTLEKTACSIVDGRSLRQFIVEHPDFATHFIHKLIRKVRVTSEKVKTLALMDAYGRVAKLLLEAADERDGHLVVREKLTHQEIADRIGCSREMVSRILRALTHDGYIAKTQGRLVVNRKPPANW